MKMLSKKLFRYAKNIIFNKIVIRSNNKSLLTQNKSRYRKKKFKKKAKQKKEAIKYNNRVKYKTLKKEIAPKKQQSQKVMQTILKMFLKKTLIQIKTKKREKAQENEMNCIFNIIYFNK